MDWRRKLVGLLGTVVCWIDGVGVVEGLRVGTEKLKKLLCILRVDMVRKYLFLGRGTGESVMISANVRGRFPFIGRC